jgi:hypothetical protein
VRRSFPLLVLVLLLPGSILAADPPADKLLYDFEDVDDLKAWSNLELPDAREKEPPVKLELSTDHATSGKHSLKPVKNEVVATLPGINDYAVHPKWGKAVRFEIFLYNPHEGESIYVDNIRLSNDKIPPPAKVQFAIQGTDWTVSGTGSAEACRELGRNLAHLWNPPAAKTLERVEPTGAATVPTRSSWSGPGTAAGR